jgi:hypothetical protein
MLKRDRIKFISSLIDKKINLGWSVQESCRYYNVTVQQYRSWLKDLPLRNSTSIVLPMKLMQHVRDYAKMRGINKSKAIREMIEFHSEHGIYRKNKDRTIRDSRGITAAK